MARVMKFDDLIETIDMLSATEADEVIDWQLTSSPAAQVQGGRNTSSTSVGPVAHQIQQERVRVLNDQGTLLWSGRVHVPRDPTDPSQIEMTVPDPLLDTSRWTFTCNLVAPTPPRNEMELELGQQLYVINPRTAFSLFDHEATREELCAPIPHTTIEFRRMTYAEIGGLCGYQVDWYHSDSDIRCGFGTTVDHRFVELYEGSGLSRELGRERVHDGCEAVLMLMDNRVRCFVETWDD